MDVLIGIELPDTTVMYSKIRYFSDTVSIKDLLDDYYSTPDKAKEIVEKYSPILYTNSVEDYIEDNLDTHDMIFLYTLGNWEQVYFQF